MATMGESARKRTGKGKTSSRVREPAKVATEVMTFLEAEADVARAKSSQRFFKGEVALFGVPAAAQRKFAKSLVQRLKADWSWSQAVRLADEAYARGRIRPGVQMDIEATRACLAAEDFDRAQARALHALEYLLAAGKLPHWARPAVERIAAAMQAQGAEDAVHTFRRRVEALLEVYGHSWDDLAAVPAGDLRSQGGRLPAQCPSCYAPLRSDEVEWVEDDRATCTYCGSIVLAS